MSYENSNKSAFAEQIIGVLRIFKEELWDLVISNEFATDDEADNITRTAFKRCAKNFNVDETTVRDKCTRQLENISTKRFLDLARQYIINVNSDLEDMVVRSSKGKDNHDDIRDAMRKVRDL